MTPRVWVVVEESVQGFGGETIHGPFLSQKAAETFSLATPNSYYQRITPPPAALSSEDATRPTGDAGGR